MNKFSDISFERQELLENIGNMLVVADDEMYFGLSDSELMEEADNIDENIMSLLMTKRFMGDGNYQWFALNEFNKVNDVLELHFIVTNVEVVDSIFALSSILERDIDIITLDYLKLRIKEKTKEYESKGYFDHADMLYDIQKIVDKRIDEEDYVSYLDENFYDEL